MSRTRIDAGPAASWASAACLPAEIMQVQNDNHDHARKTSRASNGARHVHAGGKQSSKTVEAASVGDKAEQENGL